jgi:hypothetical protein
VAGDGSTEAVASGGAVAAVKRKAEEKEKTVTAVHAL